MQTMLKKLVIIGIWLDRFIAEPLVINGQVKTFGSYQQAQSFIDDQRNGLGANASPVEVYQAA